MLQQGIAIYIGLYPSIQSFFVSNISSFPSFLQINKAGKDLSKRDGLLLNISLYHDSYMSPRVGERSNPNPSQPGGSRAHF